MYFRQLEDNGYICSEGIDGIPVRMLICPRCIAEVQNDPQSCLFQYVGYGEEVVTAADPLDPSNIIEPETDAEKPETIECITVRCPRCGTYYKYAIKDVFWRIYSNYMKVESIAVKHTYLESKLIDAGIPEAQAFIVLSSLVEKYINELCKKS